MRTETSLFSETEARIVCAQLLLALDFMNRKRIVHRDLKPENILISNRDDSLHSIDVRIADFGFAEQLSKEPDQESSSDDEELLVEEIKENVAYGTPGYIPPEALHWKGYNLKSDIYSLGSILFNLLTHKILFPGSTDSTILRSNKTGNVSHIPNYLNSI
jgi:serine/threonine protein kinase